MKLRLAVTISFTGNIELHTSDSDRDKLATDEGYKKLCKTMERWVRDAHLRDLPEELKELDCEVDVFDMVEVNKPR